jgi:S1-C subfamily serine protease
MKKLILMILASFLTLPAHAFDREEQSVISLYKKINPAIVSVDAQLSSGLSCGTGCIIDKSGIILTSAHVIEEGKNIVVTMFNGQNYNAKILRRFGDNKDIILLKINCPYSLKTVKLGDSEKIKVGQKVLAIGNPFGFNGTLTQGIVSRIDYAKNRIQTDAAINPGSSGGPLLNKHGEIIGINQAIFNPDNNISNIGIGFAIPINIIKEYLSQKNTI